MARRQTRRDAIAARVLAHFYERHGLECEVEFDFRTRAGMLRPGWDGYSCDSGSGGFYDPDLAEITGRHEIIIRYQAGGRRVADEWLALLIAHELTHALQTERHGGSPMDWWAEVGIPELDEVGYKDAPHEVEARELALQVLWELDIPHPLPHPDEQFDGEVWPFA